VWGHMLLRVEREISRKVSFKTRDGTAVNGTIHKLTRRNIVFEIYNPALLLRTSEVLTNLEVRQGKRILYNGDAVITSVVSTSILLVVSVSLSNMACAAKRRNLSRRGSVKISLTPNTVCASQICVHI
jgi:hypothetical protein